MSLLRRIKDWLAYRALTVAELETGCWRLHRPTLGHLWTVEDSARWRVYHPHPLLSDEPIPDMMVTQMRFQSRAEAEFYIQFQIYSAVISMLIRPWRKLPD